MSLFYSRLHNLLSQQPLYWNADGSYPVHLVRLGVWELMSWQREPLPETENRLVSGFRFARPGNPTDLLARLFYLHASTETISYTRPTILPATNELLVVVRNGLFVEGIQTHIVHPTKKPVGFGRVAASTVHNFERTY